MLCQFSFRNFKSYKNETTFDFQAEAIPEFGDTLLGDAKEKILPLSVIYGPNGGGKSNLLKALACLISTVVKPIYDLGKTREGAVIQQKADCEPFLLDEAARNDPTEFRIFFKQNGKLYRYHLALKNDEVVYEYLYWRNGGGKKTGTAFEREGSEIKLGASFSKFHPTKSVNPKMPYLSFLSINYNIPIIAEVQQWFESCIIRNYANPLVDSTVMMSKDEHVKKRIVQALNDMDIRLTDYRFDETDKQLYTQRTVDGKTYELKFTDESDGTQKLIAMLPILLLALREGRLVVIDELDAKLHPKLLRYIISMFRNPNLNKNCAQLLFTSHDMTTMQNTVFRRDEIWFAAENDKNESEIYSLYEIRREDNERINNTAAYAKQYLEGRYGADPYLQNILAGGEWQ